ncbi:unnamed protein product [Caenorhabditis nigoni]|uniref:Sdz-33 F-box domain-containing protein n=2 Tax=Caenorhabditis nigoni TaxID=1611254 RepID=A0A2G5TNP1_9PELO|nr:hypothetical protein B9Z55_020689 [Caenorhabditis nigoni]
MQSCEPPKIIDTRPFRLLDLPKGPLTRILLGFDFFELALANRKTRRVLKTLDLEIDGFVIHHLEGRHGFNLSFGGGKNCVSWYFVDVPEAKDPKDFKTCFSVAGVDFPTKIRTQPDANGLCNGLENVSLYNSSKLKSGYRPFRETFNVADITKRSKGQQYYNVRYTPISMSGGPLPKCWTPNVTTDYQTSLDCFVKFVQEVFKCGITGYHMDIRSVPNFGKFFTKNVIRTPCKTFELSGVRPQADSPLTMEAYDIDWLLTNTPLNTKLTINCERIAGIFKLEVPLIQKAITFNCVMKWFTYENLIESKCNQLEIETGCLLEANDYREFIEHWLKGTNKEFRYLDIRIGVRHTENMKKVLFGAFQVEECDKRRRTEDYEYTPLHLMPDWHDQTAFVNSRDLRRSDGTMSSIVVHGECLIFVVWQKKSVNKKG